MPGDLIVGDIDGVLTVPKAHVGDILQAALRKVAGEDAVRDMILDGRDTSGIFDETGIM
jgi:regulator of RNase E activity RraA